MKKLYRSLEKHFEKLALVANKILGNSFTFIIALCTVIFWLSDKQFKNESTHTRIGDVIWSVTFLSLFIIQKSFNRHSAALHLKVNELVSSHEPASNLVIHLEKKTEYEITELSKEYIDPVQEAKEEGEEKS
jgi:low affinity Fe/Cu permease